MGTRPTHSPASPQGEGRSMADEDPVLLEVKGAVAVISLNRPDKHNVVDDAADALFFPYLDLLRSDRDVRAVVWRGNGPSFSSGRDLTEMNDHPGSTDLEWVERNQWQSRVLYDFPVPSSAPARGGRSASSSSGCCCATSGWP